MKNFVINKESFLELVKKRDFRLPPFQREYSWDEENWEEFIQSITNFIDNKKNSATGNKSSKKWRLNQQEYFAGDIILKKGNEDNDFSEIIDGQQRLVTIFVLLYVIYENTKNSDIEEIIFLKRAEGKQEVKKIRIDLNNEHDKQEFEKSLGLPQISGLTKKRGRKRKPGNILKAREYFTKFFETEINYKHHEVYNTIVENFYFALVEIHHKDKVQELFTALNNTGLNLSNSDLLKTLLIGEIKKLSEKEIVQIWEKKIVDVITEASKRQTINKEMDRFLIDFWWAKFGENEYISKDKTSKPTKLSIYNLFEYKIKNNSEESYKMLNSLTDYAEVYKNIKDPVISWWEETSWPTEMFYIVNDISLLNYSQLFPIVLKMYFNAEDSPEKERTAVMKELRTTLLFIFRRITVKGKSPGDIPRFIPSILEEIDEKNRLFNNRLKQEWLDSEFNKDGREKFYDDFQIYTTKKNKIWEFVLKNYYWRKYKTKFGLKNLDFRQTIYNWKTVSIEHLIPQNPSKEHRLSSEHFGEDIIYSLGNVTLLEGKLNFQMANDIWKKKKIRIKKRGNDCPLNLEESPLFDLEELTSESIKNRSKSLINEFRDEKMKLFDIPWNQTEIYQGEKKLKKYGTK